MKEQETELTKQEEKDEICSECKSCANYLVCENGCYGNIAPCEHYTF